MTRIKLMHSFGDLDEAVSVPVGVLLITVLTVILTMIILALLLGMMPSTITYPDEIPEILKVTEIRHTDDKGKTTYASIVRLKHVGTIPLNNNDHNAELYVNGVKKYAIITTLQGGKFISTGHYGVATLSGTGITGYEWLPGEWGLINFGDQTILPNDMVEIRIICISTNKTVSKSVMTAPPISR